MHKFRCITIVVAALAVVLAACSQREGTVDPESPAVAESKSVHELDSDCLSCHPGYGSQQPRGGPALALPWEHSDYYCWDCHNPLDPTGNLASIHPDLRTPQGPSLPVVFLNRTGPNSFADGDAIYDGVCEVCHTTTAYHRNNSSGNHSHFAGADCVTCHSHYDNWLPTTGGDCLLCHNTTQPEGQGDYRRQIVANGSGGDFALPTHHVSDGTQTELVTTEDCLVCHNHSNHRSYTDGVSVYLNDPEGGPSILYDGTAALLEPFCLGCHDGAPVSPFTGGNPSPPMPPGWDASPHKAAGVTCFGDGSGCHANAHGSDQLALLSDRVALRDEVRYARHEYDLCWQCHDEQYVLFEDNRFEDLHEKHVVKEDTPCMMCHNMHAPHDAGEGLIDFGYAIEAGWDIQLINDRTLSTAFWISGSGQKGFCYLKCHNKRHRPKDYERFKHDDD